MDSAEKRKQDLERKKQKLAEIREEKRRKEDERRRTLLPGTPGGRALSPARPTLEQTADIDVDNLLAGVGIAASEHRATATASSDSFGSPLKSRSATNAVLTVCSAVQVDICDKKVEGGAYDKSVQADIRDGNAAKEFQGVGSMDFEEDDMLGGAGNRLSQELDYGSSDESPTHWSSLMPQINKVVPTGLDGADREPEKPKRPTDFTTEQKEELLMDDGFIGFFQHARRVIERGLEETKRNIHTNYASSIDTGERSDLEGEVKIMHFGKFFNDDLNLRNVTSLDVDTEKRPELFAASYRESNAVLASSAQGRDGIVCIWNMNFSQETPEFHFQSHSPVTSISFAKFHPNLFLGGTYSGRIALWDNRVHKRTPVQRSPLNVKTHTHPIFSTLVVGSATAPNLISVSSDGKMCAWSLDMLAAPVETIDLAYAADATAAAKASPVPVTCVSFLANSFNHFYVGAEDGFIYSGKRHGDGNTSGLTYGQREGTRKESAHSTFVTSIDCHRAEANDEATADFSHLYLSSSFDWTVRLWSANNNQLLHTFDTFREYVMDVQWSPVHSSVFACIDSSALQIWDIAADTENPVVEIQIEGGPLNRIQWSLDGQKLFVADTRGAVNMYTIAESLYKPEPDAAQKLEKRLNEIHQQHDDAAEIQKAMQTASTTSSSNLQSSIGTDRSIAAY